jgi:DNA-binding transcriptional MerR regulator
VADPVIKQAYLSAGELARAAGVSTDTLRHYERKRVLPRPRRASNGYRQYPPEALDRVLLVRRAIAFGFTLDELARILAVRDGGGAPCKEVRSLAASKLIEVEERLAQLTELRDGLRSTLKDWDRRLESKPDGGRAGLLEALSGGGERRSRSRAGAANNPLRRTRRTGEDE